MEDIRINKTIVGSILKGLNLAKKTGKMCNKELSLFIIMSELKELCSINNSFEINKCLDSQLRKLINKYPSICNYRERKYDNIFINGSKPLNFNSIGQIKNNTIITTDNFSTISDNDILTFTIENFTKGLNLDDNVDYSLKITSLPSLGVLSLNNINISLGQIIPFNQIEAGLLTFIPNDIDINYTVNFNFQIIIT